MRIESVNENTCMVYFGDQIGAESAGLVKRATDRLRRDMSDLIVDLVPSYTSILVTWDLEQADRFAIVRRVRAAIDSEDDGSTGGDSARIVELPVYYDREVGLDLEDVCEHAGLSRDEVVRIHSEQLYQVYAIGFAPGFAYLGSTDERIAIPRKSTPRLKVPTGSVGIAGTQTAIYPSCTPGGWQIIGRTPQKMVDWDSDSLALVQVGDQVRFRAISRDEFLELGGNLDEL
ncbi:5-oxoprolinase subunit PxpB [Marinobacter flavimaris]|jgi:KipI family sensor histidine kinase inhibitor|uniref:5-oxoprolinase subunit PxpB n=2 Tax=Marinobacter TaxID=2742 RepID=A0A3D8H5Z1_9GAMM|nr:5-oxoprolinase subunit PxpB [Marinobacter flavimaris]MCK5864382.1 5-oxoprolinase subunit PxpB [Marinobacter adhaerens]MCW8978143.1 5-oxoprolinase subunit PxpB [Marinobacter sp.]PHS46959.1 MAG: allophanate hydrolase [Marinobacter sp.]PPI81683.1 allophanate hydrolase subunit 1 [Marinobacter flavimaris]RDU42134.1 5-oxoprolinase subunit PxpB [Marinobacter flavimaris]|tara:strand:+ start:1354 stop:2046 length:693 start_codon:yes stop_codon:yes gene_type:complete